MSYIFGGNTGISYSQLQKEREREKQLREMADAMQGRIGTPSTFGAGLTALGAGLAARNKRRKAGELGKANDAAEAAGRERAQSAFQQLWGSRYGATPDSGSTGGAAAYRDAIASIESAGSGDYGAIGPANPKLGRALGRYQIMEANIGPWSREALGREVTPDEFLKNPQIQDAIFDYKFNGYVEQFGPEGAAQAWFAGPGGVGKLGRKDVLGTTVADYTDKFRGALGGGTTSARQPQGVQVAGDGATVDQIMQVMASDEYNYMSPQQQSALGMLLKQRMEANDPLRRQQLEMGQIELERARNPQPDLTADQREYQMAVQQGFEGSFVDYQTALKQAGASNVNVTNTGPEPGRYVFGSDAGLPAGWMYDTQTQKAMPVPGGPADVEASNATDKAEERERQKTIGMGPTLTNLQMNIDEIKDGGWPVTGPLGALSGRMPGTAASDWRVRNEQITTEGALNEIQNMRDSSPTGGAVGQLTDSERKALAVAATGLSDAQSAEEYVRAAEVYRKTMLDLAYGEGQWNIDGKGQLVLDGANTSRQTSGNFGGMSLPELTAMDITQMTPDEQDAWERRVRELMND